MLPGGRTHPRLRWVWRRLEGEAGLRLILFLISRELLAAAEGRLEGLLIAEPAGREVRGQIVEKAPHVEPIRCRFKSQSHHSPLSRFPSMRLSLPPSLPPFSRSTGSLPVE